MGNKKGLRILILLSVTLFLIIFFATPEFTGWFVDTLRIEVDILPEIQGCLYFINQTDQVTQNDQASFYVRLENCGSEQLNGTLYFIINDSSNLTVDEINSTEYSMNTIESFIYNLVWTASEPPGTYYITIRDNYTNSTTEINTSFFILPAPPVKRTGTWAAPTLVLNFSVEVPQKLTIYKDTKTVFLIKVTNNGDSVLNNLNLLLVQDEISVRGSPENISLLNVNSSIIFFVEIDAAEVNAGSYLLFWEVFAGNLKKNDYITIDVITATTEDECRDSFPYYIEIMDVLKEEINKAQNEGKNVTHIRQIFEETMYELLTAETFYKIESYQECINRISIVKLNIEMMVIELSRAKPEPIMLLLPLIYDMILWSIIAVLMVISTILLLRKLRKYSQERKMRSRFVLPKSWH